MRRPRVIALAALVAALVLPASTAAATAPAALVTTDVDGVVVTTSTPIETAEELRAFLLSATPKTIRIDAATGEPVSVTEGVAPTVTPFVSVGVPCAPGDSCLVAAPPQADYGFSGSAGTVTGPWTSRVVWRTGARTAQAWYVSSATGAVTTWGGKLGPNSVVPSATPVTAVRVTLY